MLKFEIMIYFTSRQPQPTSLPTVLSPQSAQRWRSPRSTPMADCLDDVTEAADEESRWIAARWR